jgi:hypothetical protein
VIIRVSRAARGTRVSGYGVLECVHTAVLTLRLAELNLVPHLAVRTRVLTSIFIWVLVTHVHTTRVLLEYWKFHKH